jgi:hypothetical protein
MGIVFLEHCSTCKSGAETLSTIPSTGIGQARRPMAQNLNQFGQGAPNLYSGGRVVIARDREG